MKKLNFLTLAALSLFASGCIDDNYDLSDIDSTVKVGVNDLVIPVNIDAIDLSSIIEIDENSDIQIIDGVYSYVTDGTFDSKEIEINAFLVNIGKIDPSEIQLKSKSGIPVPNTDITYEIAQSNPSDIHFSADGVNENIVNVISARAPLCLDITLDVSSLKNVSEYVDLNGVELQFPTGLTFKGSTAIGSFNQETATFSFENTSVKTNEGLNAKFYFSEFTIQPNEFNYELHTITLNREVGLKGGTFEIPAQYHIAGATFPENIDIAIRYKADPFYVSDVDGYIKYTIEDINIPEVNLNDIPDFLNQPGTNLKFANPCLYLSSNNPLGEYGLYAQTGLSIIAYRPDEKPQTFSINQSSFDIGKGTPDAQGNFSFCLSPIKPEKPDAGYPNISWVEYTSLSNVLSGNGLPSSIEVKLIDPQVPTQKVTNFKLGQKYTGVEGKYKFIAPFQLNEGSVIVYSDKIEDWWSEDLDYLTITYLEISLNVTTDIPVGVNFTGHPLDKNNNPIPGVSVEGAKIEPNANNQSVTIKVAMPENGFSGLGGFEFEATAFSDGGQALNENMKLHLSNLRPKVSGYYEKEL